jgi:predicted nuclease of restriction endonuclease-like (RecB) superfamily
MAKKARNTPLAGAAEPLYREICSVLEQARAGAYRAVNAAMVQAYWHVGRLIVEHEQGGRRRAAYGEAVLEDLSRRLTTDFGRGFDPSNLRYMRLFFQKFSNRGAVRHTLPSAGIRDAARHELKPADNATGTASPALRPELSWTHYRLLLGVEDDHAREWYMHEAADQHWSTRQLERQISVLYYERLLGSRKKAPVRKEAEQKLGSMEPEQFIRDPYVLSLSRTTRRCGNRRSSRRSSITCKRSSSNSERAFRSSRGRSGSDSRTRTSTSTSSSTTTCCAVSC